MVFFVLLLAALACKAAQGGLRTHTPVPPTLLISGLATPATSTPPVPTRVIVQPTSTLLSSLAGTSSPLPSELVPTLSATLGLALTDTVTATGPLTGTLVYDPAVEARQLKVFEQLWGTVRDRYLYKDFNGLDWNAVHSEYSAKIQGGMTDDAFYAAMHEMITRLGDDHSVFFSPQEAAEQDQEFQGSLSYAGIGVMTSLVPDRQRLTVILVFPGSPAEQAGIKIHDSLLDVNGQPLVDANGARISLIRGPEGSTLTITVQSPGEQPRQLQITRQKVTASMPVPHSLLTSPGGKRIGYIFIPTFDEKNISDEIGQAISDLASGGPLDGIILDNRFNPGGASDVMLNTIRYFTDGPVGYFVERNNANELTVHGQDIGGSLQAPIVDLVGKGTASFGEIFSGCLADLKRAYIIGQTTDGNVEILSIFDFSDGSRAWIATSTFRPWNHKEQDWEQTGIVPDQTVLSNWDEVNLQTDPVIAAALAHFDSLPQP